jgi:ABC-type glycerol-3-phosphate transport system permease component
VGRVGPVALGVQQVADEGTQVQVVLNDQEKFTLPVALATFAIGEYTTDYGLLMAGSVVLIAPVIVLFIALQRSFVPAIALPAQVRTRRTRN